MEELYKVTASQPGFAPIPLEILDDERIKDPTTLAVYAAVASYIDYGTASCYPSLATIGKRARVSDDTAARHLALLVQLGHVVKVKSGAEKGTSNVYLLVDAWGRGYRTGAAGGTAPMRHERDLINKKEGVLAKFAMAASEGSPSAGASNGAAAVESPLLLEIKKISGERGIGTAWLNPGWAARFEKLCREVREVDILPAFRTCLEQNGKPEFFFADFNRWVGKSTGTTASSSCTATVKVLAEKKDTRCPICGEPMGNAEGDLICIPCHARFSADMRPVMLASADDLERLRGVMQGAVSR